MRSYAETNFPTTGLVTAGGTDIPDFEIEEVFGNKFRDKHRYHEWIIPSNRDEFVQKIASVVSAMKRDLMRTGLRIGNLSSSTRPFLSTPSGD